MIAIDFYGVPRLRTLSAAPAMLAAHDPTGLVAGRMDYDRIGQRRIVMIIPARSPAHLVSRTTARRALQRRGALPFFGRRVAVLGRRVAVPPRHLADSALDFSTHSAKVRNLAPSGPKILRLSGPSPGSKRIPSRGLTKPAIWGTSSRRSPTRSQPSKGPLSGS